MELDYTYKCNNCGKPFKEPFTIYYQEYPGASYQEDYVSPCCHSTFEEVE